MRFIYMFSIFKRFKLFACISIIESEEEKDEEEEEEEKEVIEKAIMTDSSSQYEDLTIHEADIVTYKKKLRVKRRILISTQPLGPVSISPYASSSSALSQR